MEYEMTMLIQAFWGEFVCFLRIYIVLCQEYWKHYENTNINSVDWFFCWKEKKYMKKYIRILLFQYKTTWSSREKVSFFLFIYFYNIHLF